MADPAVEAVARVLWDSPAWSKPWAELRLGQQEKMRATLEQAERILDASTRAEATLERVRAVADQHQDGPEGLCTCGAYECDRYEDLRDALTLQNHPRGAADTPEAPGQPGRGGGGSGGRTGVVRVKVDAEDDVLPEYRAGYQFPYLDEFVARGVNVHFEAMSQSQFWIGIDDPATGRSWAINCGAVNQRARGYAFVEED